MRLSEAVTTLSNAPDCLVRNKNRMYEYFEGKLMSLTATNAIIDCGGVGYLLEITVATYGAIQGKKEIRLWVHEVVREDAYLLYGFYTTEEREMFRMLIGVSGVGASTARVMLSSMSVDELGQAIATQDAKRVQQVKGIGSKTAQRIVLELHDKVSGISVGGVMPQTASINKEEALSALVMLGFPKTAAEKVLSSLDAALSVEELIKEALKRL